MSFLINPYVFAASGASEIDPATLFASGEKGAFFDISDLSSMWQNTAGTTPAAVGSEVLRIDDKSGNGRNAVSSGGGRSLLLGQDANGNYYLESNDNDDSLRISWPTDLAQPLTRMSALQQDSWTNDRMLYSNSGHDGPRLYQITSTPRIQMHAGVFGPFSDDLAVGTPGIVTEFYNDTASTLTINNGTPATGTTGAQDTNNNSEMFRWTGAAMGRNYGWLIIDRALTEAETAGVRQWFANRSGVTL